MRTVIRVLITVLACAAGLAVTAPAAAASMVGAPSVSVAASVSLSAQIPVSGLPTWPVLRQGSNAAWPAATVRSLQYLLNAHGARLAVDGVFGPRTDSAVRSYQRAHGLLVDGIVGPQTWSSVIITVQRGSTGPAVKAVQDEANSRGPNRQGPPLAVDGIFGPKTDAWVRAFQDAIGGHVIGFKEDGIVGPLTWSLLVTGEKPDPLY